MSGVWRALPRIPFAVPSDLSSTTVLVTGATQGIGLATARLLASVHCSVLLACRNPETGEEVVRRIQDESGNKAVRAVHVDLASLDSVRKLGAQLREERCPLNVLINNAGVFCPPRFTPSVDGVELQVAVNHLAPFVLTQELMPLLLQNHPSRLINVSSDAHRAITSEDLLLDPTTGELVLPREENYDRLLTYAWSKMANVLHAQEIHHMHHPFISTFTLHPGVVNTNLFYPALPALWRTPFRFIANLFLRTPEKAALNIVYCALSAEAEAHSGGYLQNMQFRAPALLAAMVDKNANYGASPSLSQRFWKATEKLTAKL